MTAMAGVTMVVVNMYVNGMLMVMFLAPWVFRMTLAKLPATGNKRKG